MRLRFLRFFVSVFLLCFLCDDLRLFIPENEKIAIEYGDQKESKSEKKESTEEQEVEEVAPYHDPFCSVEVWKPNLVSVVCNYLMHTLKASLSIVSPPPDQY